MPTTWSVPPRVLADAVDLRELVRLGQVNDALAGKADAGHTHGLPTHAATHATGGGDALAPADIGAVPTSQRGPIGGVQAQTLAAGTYNLDATTFPVRRFTLTGDVTLNVPTSGADGQRITFWLGASGAQRTVTFASGYEVSPLLPSRAVVVASGTWEMVEVECRNGTWRLVQTDQLLFSASDVGGLTQSSADARYGRGIISRFRRTSNSSTTASSSFVRVMQLSAPVVAGRLYRIGCPLLMWASTAATSAYNLGVAAMTATTDGTTPTTSSTNIGQSHTPIPSGAGAAQPVSGSLLVPYVASFTGTLNVLLSIARGAGSNTLYLLYQAVSPLDLIVEDMGVDPGSVGTAL